MVTPSLPFWERCKLSPHRASKAVRVTTPGGSDKPLASLPLEWGMRQLWGGSPKGFLPFSVTSPLPHLCVTLQTKCTRIHV